MAIVELQFREQAFGDLLKRQVNSRRLPSPTIAVGQPDVDGRLLDGITAVGCELVSDNSGELTARIDLSIRSYDSPAVAKTAGSLKQPPTREARQRVPITLSVAITQPPPGSPNPPGATLVYSSPFFSGGTIDLAGLNDFGASKGAIVLQDSDPAGQGIVAIRIGTDANDALDGPVVDRIPAQADWAMVTPGSLIANQFVTGLAAAVDDAVKPDPNPDSPVYEHGALASGSYGPDLLLSFAPSVRASAEIVAVDACPVLDFDVTVTLSLLGTFATNGPDLDITLKLTWDADSTWCQIGDFFIMTPIAPFVIAHVATQQANDAILGKAKAFAGFKEIARDDTSVTFQQHRFIDIPGLLTITSSQFNELGLAVAGKLAPPQSGHALQGWAMPATSGLHVDCSPRRVTVRSDPAQAGLTDFTRGGGAPLLFADATTFLPPGAWVPVPVRSNDSQELLVSFLDPPTGRLPVGTATSVFLMTDCGLRWIDLGKIPATHAEPTQADMASMISHCMAKSAGWKERVLSVLWLPRPQAEARALPPVRQWMVGMEDIPRSTRLEFVAVQDKTSHTRTLGVIEGRSRVAVQLITDADETLQIRSNHDDNQLPVVAAQRWISPFTALYLEDAPTAIAASAGRLALRGRDGETTLLHVGVDGKLQPAALEKSTLPSRVATALHAALGRELRRGRETWNSAAQLDAGTVAVVHKGELLVGRAGELQVL